MENNSGTSIGERLGADQVQRIRDRVGGASKRKNGDAQREDNAGFETIGADTIMGDFRQMLREELSEVKTEQEAIKRSVGEAIAGNRTVGEKLEAQDKRIVVLEASPAQPGLGDILSALAKQDGEARKELQTSMHVVLEEGEYGVTKALKKATRGGFLGFVREAGEVALVAAAIGTAGYYGGSYAYGRITGGAS